jgi:MFS family permease
VPQPAVTRTTAPLLRPMIYGLILASAAAQFGIVPIIPGYAHRLGLSGLEQGLVLGATGLAALGVSLPAGALADRFGARRVTLWAGLMMTVAMLAQAFASDFAALFAARLVFGLGYGMVWTAALSWLASAAVGESAVGGSVASGGIGGVAGPAIFGLLAQHLGPAVPALATAGCFAVITIGLGAVRVPAGQADRRGPAAASVRAAAADRKIICAAVAVVIAGLTTGITSLLVPALLHSAGASSGRIGLDFAVSGVLFVVASTLTASAGRRALKPAVICGALLVMAAAISPAVVSTAPLAIVTMLCVTTTARSVLWTVSYPLAADAAQQRGVGTGAVLGLLNGIWAATAVLGPLAAGAAAEHLSARPVFGLTQATCAVGLVIAVGAAWPTAVRASGRGELPADHHPLDLVRALDDLQHLRLAHEPLGGEVLDVAVAAEYLHGVGGDPHGGVSRE